MELVWNLDDLFKNSETFYNEIECIRRDAEEFRRKYFNAPIDKELLLKILDEKWKLLERADNVWVYGSLMYYQNVKSEDTKNLKVSGEELYNEIVSLLSFVDLEIVHLGEEKVLEFISLNPLLEVYRVYIHNIFRMRKHIKEAEANDKVRENNDKINKLLNIYDTLLRSVSFGSIMVDGEAVCLDLSNYGKFLASKDKLVRKQAYRLISQAFKEQEMKFANILSEIKRLRIENSKLLGFKSVLEDVLFSENIDSKVVDSLIKSTNDNLGLMQKYLSLKAQIVGEEEPHLYDFGTPVADIKRKYSLEESVSIIKAALAPLGEQYLDVIDKLFDGHIDASLNENKHQTMTFSWHSYSFLNFRGTYVDLKNLIHEIGHIVNYYLSEKKQPYIYEDSTIFVGETASIVNEIMLTRYLIENSESIDEKLFYLTKEIENYFTSVFKQVMYTEIDRELYEKREEEELTAEFINRRYTFIRRNYYGEGINYEDEDCTEWIRLGHIYRWAFYSYKYATGLLIASLVVSKLVDEKTLSREDYIEFLSSGSNKYSLDLLRMLNIDLVEDDVLTDGFKVLENDLRELENILKLRND